MVQVAVLSPFPCHVLSNFGVGDFTSQGFEIWDFEIMETGCVQLLACVTLPATLATLPGDSRLPALSATPNSAPLRSISLSLSLPLFFLPPLSLSHWLTLSLSLSLPLLSPSLSPRASHPTPPSSLSAPLLPSPSGLAPPENRVWSLTISCFCLRHRTRTLSSRSLSRSL